MDWEQVRAAYPDQWLVIDVLEAHTDSHRRTFDRIAVVETCGDGPTAKSRCRDLRQLHPDRELCFVHTGIADLNIVERAWAGVQRNDGPPQGISIDDHDEIRRRAAEARTGAPGIPWTELKRELLK